MHEVTLLSCLFRTEVLYYFGKGIKTILDTFQHGTSGCKCYDNSILMQKTLYKQYHSGMPCVLSCVKCLFSLVRTLQTLGKGGILNDLRIIMCELCKFESVLTSFFVLCSIQVKNDGI